MELQHQREARLPESVADDELVVVRASLEVPVARQAELWASLSADERARADRYHFARDRARGIASRGLLREVLGRILRVRPADLVLTAGAHGKPAVTWPDAPAINVSHAEAHVLIALGRGRALGVDIEGGERPFEVDDLVRIVFTDEERRALATFARADRRAAFLRAWTRKEAYLKARSVGLSMPLTDFSVSLDVPAGEIVSTVDPAEAARFALAVVPAPARYEAAIAWERTGVPVQTLRLIEVE